MSAAQPGRLGATVVDRDGSVRFEVWAPEAECVEVVFDDGETHALSRSIDPAEPGVPTWVATVAGAGTDRRYAFAIDDGDPLPDPASRFQPEGVHGRSQVVDPTRFEWSDHDWRGIELDEAVVYELHVGVFTEEGTFDAAIAELPRLVDLGITVIEVMPVNACPGERNWGYDGVFPFATQASYGGPAAFARFVDAAHGLGLAVILDVVYNHLGPEGNVLGRFGPYLTDDYRTPWGPAINVASAGSDGVRRFLTENVEYWLRDLHLDGFRMDAVHAIIDPSARPVIAELVDAAHAVGADGGRTVLVMLESAANDPRMVRARADGGWGADAMWNDDVHHALRVALTGERHEYYAAFSGVNDLAQALERNQVYEGQHSPTIGRRHGAPAGDVDPRRFVAFSSNHDHVGNTPSGQRLLAGAPADDPRHRLAAAFVLLSPFTPLLFMGEEYGEPAPFPYFIDHGDPDLVEAVRRGRREEFADHDWGEVADPADPATFRSAVLDPTIVERDPVRRGRLAMYRELLALRRRHRTLLTGSVDQRSVSLADGVLRVDRRAGATRALLEFRFADTATTTAVAGGITFSSAAPRWRGDSPDEVVEPTELGPWEARLVIVP